MAPNVAGASLRLPDVSGVADLAVLYQMAERVMRLGISLHPLCQGFQEQLADEGGRLGSDPALRLGC